MSIKIDTDLAYIQSKLNISDSKMEIYKDKTVEEILEAEAASGNQAAIQLAADMFTDSSILIELFQLADPQNKLTIMKEMTSSQLEKLVPMLEEDDLIQGLQYFTQDSLLDMLKDIPKEELLKAVFQMFSESEVIEHMPERELDRLLTSFEMDKEMLLQNLKSIPEMYLQQILESVTGQEAQGNNTELVQQISQLGDLNYKNAIMNLEPTQKRQLTFMLTNEQNKYYQIFDTEAYIHMINVERNKEQMIKSMGVIKPEYLQGMVNELPQDLLAIVTTQIDTEKFADALINRFPELLAKFVAG